MISLITTLLNEKKNIGPWLESILSQSVCPDEIVIVDGGSTDGSWEWLQEQASKDARIKVYQFNGNISSGRNYAIQMAAGDSVVVADAGCYYHNDWYKTMSEPLMQGYELVVGAFGPWFKPEDSFLKMLIFAATTPAPSEFVSKKWLPSSRTVAFTKDLWQRAGFYPEWLPICEDIVFDIKMLKLQPKVFYQRQPMAFWEARDNLKKYFWQLFRYTRGDGHGKLWLKRQLARYATYAGSLVLLLLVYSVSRLFLILLSAGFVVYLHKFWQRWLAYTGKKSLAYRIAGLAGVPLVIIYGDIAKMAGWPVGVYQRLTGKIKFENY